MSAAQPQIVSHDPLFIGARDVRLVFYDLLQRALQNVHNLFAMEATAN